MSPTQVPDKNKDEIENDIEEMLNWVESRFVKSMARVQCLSVIAKGHTHGYDIMKYVEDTYDLKVSPGSYYPILQSLEEKEYIKGTWEHSIDGKPGKKTYTITKKGRRLLNEVKKRLSYLVDSLSSEKQ